MRARSVAGSLWRRRWTALFALVLVAAAAIAWLAFAPRRYTATASVTAVPRPGVQQTAIGDVEGTIAALANSRPVLQDVLAKLGPRRSLQTLRREVSGQRVPGTMLVRVRVTDANAAFAATAANAVVDTLPLHDPTGGRLVFTDAGRAVPPGRPSRPDRALVIWIAVGAGVVLAVMAALLREALARGVNRPEELARLTGAQVLGVVTPPADPAAVSVAKPGPAADQFRRVRVALEFAGSETPTRTVVVAPVTGSRAASWFAANLAATLAQVRHRVLLIDADNSNRPRHPLLAHKGDGLAEVLAQTVPFDQALMPSDVPGVCVLPLGDPMLLRSEPLVELQFHRTLAQVSPDAYDIVLVAAAPLDESDDARVMAASNSLLISVPGRRIRPRAIRRELAEVRRMRLRLIGSVLLRGRREA